jgi:lipopolysaccharide transport system ATP-binding protein
MSEIAIRADAVSKQYRIGAVERRPDTLRDLLSGGFQRLVRRRHGLPAGQAMIWALRDVSFEIRQGEVVGIIGRNGAGKSTLLKILSRITEPTSGMIEIVGRVGSLLEVGTGFHPDLTGRENIYLNGAVLGMKKAEIDRKFDEIVDFAETEKFLETPVKHYSSGMYVRLAFAVAAHLEPEVLIVDEVLAVGDAAFQAKCLGRMQKVAGQGRTVLFVSHNMESVQALCQRGIYLAGGRIVADTSARSAATAYLADFARASTHSLRHRTDRLGNGRIRFTEFWLEGADGSRMSNVIVGQDVRFCLAYMTRERLRNLYVGFNLYKDLGNVLVNCNNSDVGHKLDVGPGEGVIVCTVKRFPVRAGRYLGSVYSAADGVPTDWVQGAYSVDVVDGDFYGTGKLSPVMGGSMLILHDWETRCSEGSALAGAAGAGGPAASPDHSGGP